MPSRAEQRNLSEHSVESISAEVFELLSRTFPVCSASDEFYYFPQVTRSDPEWYAWDDFSPGALREVTGKLATWTSELADLAPRCSDPDSLVDLALLEQTCRTLRGQLLDVGFHRTQPTFYLTVANIGLLEALESAEPEAWAKRAAGLPAFLDQATRNLADVPVMFRDLGLTMAEESRKWLESLRKSHPGVTPVEAALSRFAEALRRVSTRRGFLLPSPLLERIVRDHLGCRTDFEETVLEIDREISEMHDVLAAEAGRLHPGASWEEVVESIPKRMVDQAGVQGIYRDEAKQLERHCVELGFITPELASACPVRVAPVPESLTSVRAADAYSAKPGHPPSGGTFYLQGREAGPQRRHGIPREYRMLTAHETYPGHHLLDTYRWSHARPVRRSLESPLFYEGWACFAEHLAARTGYFCEPWDRLLLAKRRLRRAVRAKVDLALQAGRIDLDEAAEELARAGFSHDQAMSSARKYALRPGYQVCYTIGIRRFLSLFDRARDSDAVGFARKVLAQGEIAFGDLEQCLKNDAGARFGPSGQTGPA